MDQLDFKYNWNNKLSNKCFTSIRLHNNHKYNVGSVYEITIKKQRHCDAVLVDKKMVEFKDINEWIARIDTGYNLEAFKKMFFTMYKNIVQNWDHQLWDLLLFERVEPEQADLFKIHE